MAFSPRSAFVSALLCAGLVVSGCAGPDSDDGEAQPPGNEVAATSPAPEFDPDSEFPAAESPSCRVELAETAQTPREKAARLLTVGVASFEDARAAITEHGIGGIFVGSAVADDLLTDGKLAELHALSQVPLLVSIDEEGGRVSRIASLVGPMPSAREMARTKTPDEVREVARVRGEQLREMGVTVDFAPSVDVSAQPDDAVIGDRSFSDDPEVVTTYARAFAEGLLEAGITPVFKHFPGHGRSSGDSHYQAVTIPAVDELHGYELQPFVELVGMPGTAAMLGHLTVPGLTEPDVPATLSPAAHDLLRSGGYGGQPFEGAVFSDDLSGMQAITDAYTIDQAVVMSLAAGTDSPLWISTDGLPAVLDAIDAAIADGRITEAQLDRSLERMSELRDTVTCR